MPVQGRKPKPQGQAVNRVRPTYDWVEVEDRPFDEPHRLPPKRPDGQAWPVSTKRWWRVVSTMPHCVLWTEADWQFAIQTAVLVAAFDEGDLKLGTELRNRDKKLGMTLDSRRDLRIRYVEPKPETPLEVVSLDEYRNL